MEMDTSNVSIKCMGKALGKKIKYICTASIKFFDSSQKDITKLVSSKNKEVISKPEQVFICLGQNLIIFVASDLSTILEAVSYDNIIKLELDKKSQNILHIYIEASKKNTSIKKITVTMKNRQVLLNNIRCYYTVYYETYKGEIKSLPCIKPDDKDKAKPEKKEQGSNSKFHEEIIKNYSFYLKGVVKKNTSSPGYNISYFIDKKKNEQKKEQEYFSGSCTLIVDIFDPAPISKFDHDINSRDLSYFAYENMVNFLNNNLKCPYFWLLKNEIFTKKINLNEDMSLWEGWRIDVRICQPEYKNLIFIFLRRKFIPPYFDTYQDFIFVLSEDSSYEKYEINPEADIVISLAANTLSSPITCTVKDSQLFLEAKVDALLVDEETLYYYQNFYGIRGREIFKFGYELLTEIINYFSTTNVKNKIQFLTPVVNFKKKKFELDRECTRWDFKKDNKKNFMPQIKERIREAITRNELNKSNNEPIQTTTGGNNTQTGYPIETLPSKTHSNNDEIPVTKFSLVWTKKLMRFIGFVLNGGLTDFKMNYSTFLKEVYDGCQITNNDIKDLCYNTIFLRDLQQSQNRKKLFQPYSIMSSIREDSVLTYNSEPLEYCISSNFLHKHLDCDSKFIPTLLLNHFSNKLLIAIYNYLKNANQNEEKDLIKLISPLNRIFQDQTQNPSTLLLVCKSLCILVKSDKKKDENNRIKLVESNVIKTISDYLKKYDYDQSLVSSCLDLFTYVSSEEKNLREILFNKKGTGLVDVFMSFLVRPKVPGVYYSQRIMIKILTVLLKLTSKGKAGLQENMNTSNYQKIYVLLLNLVDDEKKREIIDPLEEESSTLEFKIFYLINLLSVTNKMMQDMIYETYNFDDIIQKCSVKYLEQMKKLVELKDKATESEKTTIGKKIYKFIEMVFYFMIKSEDRAKDIESLDDYTDFRALKHYCDNNMRKILQADDMKSNVLLKIENLFKKVKEDS